MCVAQTCKRFRSNARLGKRDKRFFATKNRVMGSAAKAPVKGKK